MPKEGDDGGLRTSLGPGCRAHAAGWEGRVGPTPSCGVWSQREHLTERLGQAGLRVVAWDAQCWAPLGLAETSPSLQLGPWAQGANTLVSRAGVAAAASAL